MSIPATLTLTDATALPWDAAIIGAGPAGSVAAGLLARAGLRTLLIDRAQFPRRKVCGCCLNQNALAALAAAELGDVPARLSAVPLHRVRLAAGGRAADLAWPAGVSLSREAFDAELVREAIRRGAAFLPGTRATMGEEAGDGRIVEVKAATSNPLSPGFEGERVRVRGGDFPTNEASLPLQRGLPPHPDPLPLKAGGEGEIRPSPPTTTRLHARIVIVADGLNGQLAGEANANSRIGAGAMIPNPPAEYAAGTVFMATAAGGYVGLVRVEDGRLDVAAALDAAFVRKQGGLGEAAAAILRHAGLPAIDNLAVTEWKGTPALTRSSRTVAGPRWFAVGDAGGYVEPFTGEGMGWAISAAVAVVPLATGGTDAGEWARTYRRIVGRRQAVCKGVAWTLRRPAACRTAVRLLSVVPQLSGPVIRAIHHPARVSSNLGKQTLPP
ncbi:NAD(P)/FAD-dependent oxidoreductase [Limnoglobus roseus]|uniref:NAD-binding protein n=1 Tax=Limnoglobus roseus TaxID=2598579 RepID=A0A5C1A7Y2_9BACT|nr:NAD(P)/FAD-dependent oxidoreductase [Limnoglobus roseus]QEL13278.1 NAD-binding protein [Limnoglobus roseus]